MGQVEEKDFTGQIRKIRSWKNWKLGKLEIRKIGS